MLQLQLSALNCKGSPACTVYGTSNSMDSGYPLDLFCDSVSSDLICDICGKVLNSPRVTECGHVFCLRCLEFWIEYYGICPKRCGEIDSESLRKETQTEKTIMSLLIHCKYSGCRAQIPLAEKSKHEKKCRHKPKADRSLLPLLQDSEKQSDSYVEMASVACHNKGHGGGESAAAHLHPLGFATAGLAYHTYHLKRRSPGESFGFVLVAGAKNSNGKAVNFSIKTVNPGTVAAEVGLQQGDKILQVDNIGLSQLAQQEAVSRIKDNPEVILTVLRARRPSLEEHVYEDILYSDIPLNGQQENSHHHSNAFRDRLGSAGNSELMKRQYRKKSEPFADRLHLMPSEPRRRSPTQATVTSDPTRSHLGSPKILTEKVSADSGLSSNTGSFSSPHNARERLRAYHSDPHTRHEMLTSNVRRPSSQERRGSRGSHGDPSPLSRTLRIEGEYEVEEIFLQKNGTNQLGITLGYDTTAVSGSSLYVCEVIDSGLAAKDGRIRKGDIIRKVNGFEVYDPEEAVLLFLEQDQDISLTVARRIKIHRKGLMSSKSQSSLLSSHLGLMDIHESTADRIRRTDSCGSLDSHSHSYRRPTFTGEQQDGSRRHSESVAASRGVSSPLSRNPPSASSIGSTGLETSSIGTDFVFQPIKEGRPATAGQLFQPVSPARLMRSSTSIGSAPEAQRSSVQVLHQPMTRHQSLEARRLRSISPNKPPPASNYRPREIMSARGHQVAPASMYRSVSTVRCESLV